MIETITIAYVLLAAAALPVVQGLLVIALVVLLVACAPGIY